MKHYLIVFIYFGYFWKYIILQCGIINILILKSMKLLVWFLPDKVMVKELVNNVKTYWYGPWLESYLI